MTEEKTLMTVSRRAFALGTAAIAALAAMPAAAQSELSAEDRAVLAQAQAYLQGLTSAQGNFVETSGVQRREGRFWLQRPGKMRFEYTSPAGLLVVSDGSNVKRYDPRLNVFRQVPLGATPLSTFLARNVRFDQGVRIDRVTRMASGAFAITARDARRPDEGSVILSFAAVYFNPDDKPSPEALRNDAFFAKLSVREQAKEWKREINRSTIDWWEKQCLNVRKASLYEEVVVDTIFQKDWKT
jgi:outer membrane lipoprotein-sorting protein